MIAARCSTLRPACPCRLRVVWAAAVTRGRPRLGSWSSPGSLTGPEFARIRVLIGDYVAGTRQQFDEFTRYQQRRDRRRQGRDHAYLLITAGAAAHLSSAMAAPTASLVGAYLDGVCPVPSPGQGEAVPAAREQQYQGAGQDRRPGHTREVSGCHACWAFALRNGRVSARGAVRQSVTASMPRKLSPLNRTLRASAVLKIEDAACS